MAVRLLRESTICLVCKIPLLAQDTFAARDDRVSCIQRYIKSAQFLSLFCFSYNDISLIFVIIDQQLFN